MKNRTVVFIIILFFIISCQQSQPTEYVLDEIDLVPEGIAYSQKMKAFYLTSITKSKIIVVDQKNGKQHDFIAEQEFGFTPGCGIWVDDLQDKLYAVGGFYKSSTATSFLYSFELSTGQLIKKYEITDTGDHFLNDMVIDNKSNIYLTDTKASSIYLLKSGTDSLQQYFASEEIQYPNGIAISEDFSKLYIASHTQGIRVLDLATKIILNEKDTTLSSKGIDGLEFYNGNLYAIQNAIRATGYNFRKLILNKTQDHISGVEIIDYNNPKLDVPLTFCIAGTKAVVIGNSNLQYLNQDNLIFTPTDSTKNTRLLVYEL
ncbi:MAG: hypothetical protein A2W99_05260 [Bacteroidetes bacterium GWF2_33_16]|nr:MAG: hypothetical protein A2X00_17780 [Bacteroidetes bacterium GWE2_32_14]OFY06070.1 MAG: hypothetical protein A2W99_05260 [Bacteroidetes bacterium GWF2_33_16]